jgi:phosphatidylglycerol---prolipoprotein diacylglyceryl transferase
LYPQLRLGPFTLNTFGLALSIAFLCAWLVLKASVRREAAPRHMANVVIVLLILTGVVGAKLHHVSQTPSELIAHPFNELFSIYGYAWFGGFLAGVCTLWLLARHYKMPVLKLMDLASPAAALGYAIGRLGCLLSGDGDYGTPTSLPWGMSFPDGIVPTIERVHPTPIYESIASATIFCYLMYLLRKEYSQGSVFAQYLVLTGITRFAVEFIRINPRFILGLTEAQAFSLLCIFTGVALLYLRSNTNSLTRQYRWKNVSSK